MLDIGAMELFVVAVLALVVVGPKELPKLLRTVGGFMRKVRMMAADGVMKESEKKLFALVSASLQMTGDQLNQLIDDVIAES